eukprot:677584-Amphidinium_carterae.1
MPLRQDLELAIPEFKQVSLLHFLGSILARVNFGLQDAERFGSTSPCAELRDCMIQYLQFIDSQLKDFGKG